MRSLTRRWAFVQVLRRAQLRIGAQLTISLHLAHGAMRCRTPVQCDSCRSRSLTFDGLTKERLGRGNIAPGTQAKFHGLSRAVHRPVQIHPLAAHLHVGLVDAPRRPNRPCEPVPAALEPWRITMHPAHDGGVGDRQIALGDHLHQVPEAELEAQVPPHAQPMISPSKWRPSNSSSKLSNPAISPPSTRQELNDREAAELHQSHNA
jgi:hypothetical protein